MPVRNTGPAWRLVSLNNLCNVGTIKRSNVRYRTVSTVLLKFGFGVTLNEGFRVCLPGY